MEFYLNDRVADGDIPGGVTISKHPELPDGDFTITEYTWGNITLWFVEQDNWTADERQAVYESLYAAGLRAQS